MSNIKSMIILFRASAFLILGIYCKIKDLIILSYFIFFCHKIMSTWFIVAGLQNQNAENYKSFHKLLV